MWFRRNGRNNFFKIFTLICNCIKFKLSFIWYCFYIGSTYIKWLNVIFFNVFICFLQIFRFRDFRFFQYSCLSSSFCFFVFRFLFPSFHTVFLSFQYSCFSSFPFFQFAVFLFLSRTKKTILIFLVRVMLG